ncbi:MULTISPECIES: MFS transporter [Pseudomonas]|uniref:MFS transporter n=1 Tax=Pseudomonas TaxID=286 RepID=UPI000F538856|nr:MULTISPECIES: MFS transporter [Pseudomonas]MCE1011555.1 MFS transporter [Pseudomonas monteilii]MDM3873464.1 MFS transporter [Pseudomonas asiatica]MDT3714399.1 MFS transporter [Pseudomonas soli]MDT3731117.1 MFS transporter [Pseudomonas soli]
MASITVFAFATLLLGLWGYSPQMVYLSVMTWGFAFGGFATITQTALSRFAGDSVDVAQSVYTTGWNTAVASGGVVGGLLLERTGVASFAWIVIGILAISLLGTVFAMNKVLKGNR